MFTVLTVVVLVAILVLLVWWAIKSIRTIPANMVGIAILWGKPFEKVFGSGLRFVPWPCKIVHIPTKLFKLTYEGGEQHKIWSRDRQLLFPQATLYLQFPYSSGKHLVDMIQRDVPFTEEALTDWAEDVIIPALRRVLAKRKYQQAIDADELGNINTDVNSILMADGSVLRTAGVYGDDPNVIVEGTGFARLEVEQIMLTEELQKKEQAVATAALDIEVARCQADAEAARISAVNRAMDEWVNVQARKMKKSVAKALTVLKADGSWAKQYSMFMAQVEKPGAIVVGNTDGTPLSGDMGAGIAFAGALAGLFGRGGGRQNYGNRGNRGGGPGGGQQGGQGAGGISPGPSPSYTARQQRGGNNP
jgi:hypothetical protein